MPKIDSSLFRVDPPPKRYDWVYRGGYWAEEVEVSTGEPVFTGKKRPYAPLIQQHDRVALGQKTPEGRGYTAAGQKKWRKPD